MRHALPQSFRLAVSALPGPFAVATIDEVTRPAPLPVGEQLLVWEGGAVGSISAGCVESDVIAVAHRVLADGRPRTRTYGPEGAPFAATTCGGTLRVGIEPVTAGGDPDQVLAAIAERGRRAAPTRRLFLVGATTLAASLASIAGPLGYRVVVMDPRPAFATAMQVADADEVICGWPDRELGRANPGPHDALVLLTHDERYATAVLAAALRAGVGYVGALGSVTTAERHRTALAAAGVAGTAIAALRSPVGIAIGASGPGEIAVAIAAEVIAHR
ncbi:Xanthine dehydrogenase accessory protein XdhC OS=Tsukamurella paurometabola (strain ATCC 8368 / DSM / CCUG 35730 / CIP 100753 / JCM 10117 / KCTC 9821 /NBRC 16120 / NCIMB 702349 / NCTC 13040) OX=521096 GN=Tpau_2963 PE=4 SV=1 [Tsukamurella paurometabola]|uniref:Xanthine dehydrogenase accessory protein XdhC n=1 Tax=Tsukamurella paurometabola (strain ATCC 8368 / DSM 20162 / CCUG 35730 / CIP 100753 / JCM 10117 / KCTC 9821 / NBRC 16120 / NCIMB 702349 / NCTC 13040) TaxID=521096 RepID=D5UU56_TSUPD|nr:XdhC/CoxI family protein [Tsukamurella paurometabola]ADG79559.1 protein of unknown function DUF182 [Tsukamurella paurometabola DSM 20162]SUP36234.1 xanthine dehydrogenase accessory protein XdhC [Tsukamurella paurometabola]